MKARVDPDLCIGCGICPEVCPAVFEMGDDDKAHVKVEKVPAEAEAACRDAAEQCPGSAIQVED
jgi:ferredoxin